MKALVLKEHNHFEYKDIPVPEIKDNEVLIKVKAVGICGSDIHGIDGSTGRRIPPVVMGHEASGIIEKVGSSVSGWKKGDRVTFDSTIYCGKCHFCRSGKINLCENRRVLGVSCEDYRQNGAFAEYVAVPKHILYRIPKRLSFEEAAMVEPLSIAFHAVHRTPISLNDTVVVVGSGIIGLLLIQTLRASGCGNIIAVDIDDGRLNLACKLGADRGLNSERDNIKEEVLEVTKNFGADLSFEVVGVTPTIKTAVEVLKKGGIITLIGNISPTVEFPLQSVVTKEISINGSCASSGEYLACLSMIARGSINVKALISKIAPLSEGADWFKRLYHKEPGLLKVILKP
jgi:L-iditol 2-dehydrogenase